MKHSHSLNVLQLKPTVIQWEEINIILFIKCMNLLIVHLSIQHDFMFILAF